MKTIVLERPKDLPKCGTLRVQRTVQPDVRMSYAKWVLHHRKVNHKVILLR